MSNVESMKLIQIKKLLKERAEQMEVPKNSIKKISKLGNNELMKAYRNSLELFVSLNEEIENKNRDYYISLDEGRKMIFGYQVCFFVKELIDSVEKHSPSLNGNIAKEYVDEVLETYKSEFINTNILWNSIESTRKYK